jgi:hypothetical protein
MVGRQQRQVDASAIVNWHTFLRKNIQGSAITYQIAAKDAGRANDRVTENKFLMLASMSYEDYGKIMEKKANALPPGPLREEIHLMAFDAFVGAVYVGREIDIPSNWQRNVLLLDMAEHNLRNAPHHEELFDIGSGWERWKKLKDTINVFNTLRKEISGLNLSVH